MFFSFPFKYTLFNNLRGANSEFFFNITTLFCSLRFQLIYSLTTYKKELNLSALLFNINCCLTAFFFFQFWQFNCQYAIFIICSNIFFLNLFKTRASSYRTYRTFLTNICAILIFSSTSL